ncbi:DUF2306 domain-containing protein [Sphingomonas sp. HITSZ_GF]|uniref:DUF2306 domain-containing protein n=1 Tax=Sphingomonas sp. HITSZ_GF TaxID=3037247 RepID=UPI00240E50D5|nr:DUF2306 domain-containing protein [Sphingomonas sp. HITSZ_GF]MDG2535316.1 DUF2306 domain-containing protein [Sphingomonas sp. HITSZ_GF]
MATLADVAARPSSRTGEAALRGAAILLVAASWVSAGLFGAFILAFYGGTAAGGAAGRWNETLPNLHSANLAATLAIGAHFVTGGTLLLLGPVQLVAAIRNRVPALHRWLGRLYVLSAALAGTGGLVFIATRGTIGGPAMDIGFGIYGALMVLCAGLAYAHARARRIERHRAWAIRLFALAIGSWLYRMDYGFWFLAFGKAGHTPDFRGGFDLAMDFAFYLPNLAIAELFLRARRTGTAPALRYAAAALLLGASAFILLATWFFATRMWFPGMAAGWQALSG